MSATIPIGRGWGISGGRPGLANNQANLDIRPRGICTADLNEAMAEQSFFRGAKYM